MASCALAGAIAVPDVAVAAGVSPIDATAEQRKLATDHFAQGKQALAVGNLEKAIEELRASLDVVDSPNAHLELARALRDSGNPAEAWLEYGRAVAVATQLAPKEERYAKTGEAASNERVDVEGKLGFVAVTVTRAPDGASLHVGGRVVAPEEWNAPVPVTPGSFDVVLLDIGGAEIARRTVSVAIGQTVPVSLDVVPAPPAKASADVSDDEMPSSAASPPLPRFRRRGHRIRRGGGRSHTLRAASASSASRRSSCSASCRTRPTTIWKTPVRGAARRASTARSTTG